MRRKLAAMLSLPPRSGEKRGALVCGRMAMELLGRQAEHVLKLSLIVAVPSKLPLGVANTTLEPR